MKFTIKNDNGFFSSSLEVIYDFVYNKCTVTLLSFGNENLFELLFKFQREKNWNYVFGGTYFFLLQAETQIFWRRLPSKFSASQNMAA